MRRFGYQKTGRNAEQSDDTCVNRILQNLLSSGFKELVAPKSYFEEINREVFPNIDRTIHFQNCAMDLRQK